MITREILLTAMFIIAGAVPFAGADSSDVAEIRTMESKLAAAVEARDLDKIMKVYIPDETLFVFDVIPPREYVGAKAFRKDWEEFLGSTTGPI
jgi:ketosteroid isomerase-like protein